MIIDYKVDISKSYGMLMLTKTQLVFKASENQISLFENGNFEENVQKFIDMYESNQLEAANPEMIESRIDKNLCDKLQDIPYYRIDQQYPLSSLQLVFFFSSELNTAQQR